MCWCAIEKLLTHSLYAQIAQCCIFYRATLWKSAKVIKNDTVIQTTHHFLFIVSSMNLSSTVYQILPFWQCTSLLVTLRSHSASMRVKIIGNACLPIRLQMCNIFQGIGFQKLKQLSRSLELTDNGTILSRNVWLPISLPLKLCPCLVPFPKCYHLFMKFCSCDVQHTSFAVTQG